MWFTGPRASVLLLAALLVRWYVRRVDGRKRGVSVGGFNNKNNNHDASQAPFVWGKFLRGKITDENNNKSTFLFTTQNSISRQPSGRNSPEASRPFSPQGKYALWLWLLLFLLLLRRKVCNEKCNFMIQLFGPFASWWWWGGGDASQCNFVLACAKARAEKRGAIINVFGFSRHSFILCEARRQRCTQ